MKQVSLSGCVRSIDIYTIIIIIYCSSNVVDNHFACKWCHWKFVIGMDPGERCANFSVWASENQDRTTVESVKHQTTRATVVEPTAIANNRVRLPPPTELFRPLRIQKETLIWVLPNNRKCSHSFNLVYDLVSCIISLRGILWNSCGDSLILNKIEKFYEVEWIHSTWVEYPNFDWVWFGFNVIQLRHNRSIENWPDYVMTMMIIY